MPISEYTGREITEDQKKVEDAWNRKAGKDCNIKYSTKISNKCENFSSDGFPIWEWRIFDYFIKSQLEQEKLNFLPWNTDIFNMPGFPPDIDQINAEDNDGFYGSSIIMRIDTDGLYFPLQHNCTDFENSTLYRPGTEKILPCPNECGGEINIENPYPNRGDLGEFYHCTECHFMAPKSSWQKRKV